MKIITIALLFQFLLSCWPKVNIIVGIIFYLRWCPSEENNRKIYNQKYNWRSIWNGTCQAICYISMTEACRCLSCGWENVQNLEHTLMKISHLI